MTIFDSVALEALRNGRTTRMTDSTARTEQRLEMLAATLADTRQRRQNAEQAAIRLADFETYLSALIERERTSPTLADAPADAVNGTDQAPPPEHGVGSTLSGARDDGDQGTSGKRPASWPA